MRPFKTFLASAVVAASAFAVAAPAGAVVTTFAQYQAVSNVPTIYWKNNGTTSTNGTGGSVYTIAAKGSTVPGSVGVSFSFLQPSIAPYVTNVGASFTLLASAVSSPAQLAGNILIQPGITGSFSFVTTSALVVGSNTFAAGSNLLSGTFSQAAVVGQRLGSSGSLSASSTAPDFTISYTSDFLSFEPGASLDFAISLTSITSALQATPTGGTPTRALRNFRANSTGSFSADPAPIVTAVPEPAVWGLMIVGFGMIGVQKRRRAKVVAA